MNPPNVIFVFSDQQRYNTMGCTGNSVVKTPALDRLAAEGMLLEQAFSSCPICSPYRAQLMTGRYSHMNGVLDNEYALRRDQTFLAEAFSDAGYRTGYVGKWHLGYGPYTAEKRVGFDYMAAYNCGHDYFTKEFHENEEGPFKIEKWAPEGETDLAIRFMEQHLEKNEEMPFFMMLSWGPPHWPYHEYPKEYDIYDPATVDLPPNVPMQMAAFARRELADYCGNITGLDVQMGRLLEWLDQHQLRENTIVCYTSDHGDHLSSHGYGKPWDNWLHHTKRASKATPYEESIHVPFIASCPGRIPAGQKNQTLFSSVDIMPTLLSLAGVPIPAGVQGQDLSHAMLGTDGPEPDSVYLQLLGPGWPHRGDWVGFWRGLRTERWVYARWLNTNEKWLFDREADPFEMRNLVGRPEHAAIEEELELRLQRWLRETDDPFETGSRDPKTGMLELGQTYIHEKWLEQPS